MDVVPTAPNNCIIVSPYSGAINGTVVNAVATYGIVVYVFLAT